ncbi:septum formation initiator family protein [Patescibacteria group bacterium]
MKRQKNSPNTVSLKLKKNLGYVIVILSFLLMFSFFQSIQRARSAGNRIDTLKNRVGDLEQRKLELEIRVSEAQTEDFVETELREKLGLARENEIVIILPEDEIIRKFAPKKDIYEEKLPDSNWKKWMNLFL